MNTHVFTRHHTAACETAPAIYVADWAALLGRIALAVIFIWSGYGKLADISGTAGYMSAHDIPFATLLVWPAALLEFIGGFMLLAGWYSRWAALALALFTLVAGAIFHNFWAVPGDQVMNQTIHFMKNVAIAGGLLQLFAFGPGRYAVSDS
jgi:putative oxidoreductase